MKGTTTKFLFLSALSLLFLVSAFLRGTHAQTPFIEITAGPSKPLPPDYLGQNAANIIQVRSLTDGPLRSKIPQLHPSTIRHIASSQANWWDWRKGWLMKQEDLLPGYTIRDDWAVLDPMPDKISDLKYLADTTGASVIYAPNMLTSRLDYQVAALFEFASQNILAPYVEMGSEFYLDNTSANLRFPTCVQYADTSTKWIAGFKSLFPNVKISCIGATEQGNSVRRNTWTQTVVDLADGYDALSVKVFLPTGLNLPDSIIPKNSLPKFFSKPFKAMEPTGEVGIELSKLPADDEMWISEYNLTDQRYAINGHWAHGLFEAAMTLCFLSDSRITRISQFRMSGDALHGNLFESAQGFKNGPAFVTLNPDLPTNINEFTAVGNAMRLIGSSLHLATAVSPLIFTPQNGAVIDALNGGYPALYGYRITKPVDDEMIMLNLSDDSTLLQVQGVLDSSIVYYEVMWCIEDTSRRPLVEVTGDLPVLSGTISNGEIYIPPYSIIRLYQKKEEVYAEATDDTICRGTSTTLLAYGADGYTWQPPVTTTGDGAVAYISPSSTTTYTVTATSGCNGAGCTKTLTINVVEPPQQGVIVANPSGSVCPGTAVTLTVAQTDATKFCWTSPDVGSQFAQSSITVSPHDTTTYYLFGANNGCYSYRDSIIIYMRPSAQAGPDLMDCLGDSLMIGSPTVAGLTYQWSPAAGLSNPQIAQPMVSPASVTDYILTVTDPVAACSDKDTVQVDPVKCCSGAASTPVFPPNTTASAFINTMLTVFGADGNAATGVVNGFTEEIIINGSFIVDTNLSIINCPKIKFGEKSRIYVTQPNVKLKLKGDSLQSCGAFPWSGMVNSNILSSVIIDSCFISGADTVLLTMNDADYEIRNSCFHNNHCGVYMLNYLEELENEVPEGSVYGTIFEGDNNSTGITAEHVSMIIIGDRTKSPNIFRDMHSGISIQNSNASIINNFFHELEQAIQLADTFSNTDLAPLYNVTIGGDEDGELNSFEKTSVAIYSDYMKLLVRNNAFYNCDYPVWAVNTVSRSIEVSQNLMTGVFKGVNLVGNRTSDYVIKNNNITTAPIIAPFYPVGIQVTDLYPGEGISGSARITANEINCYGLYGIQVTNSNGKGYDPAINVTPQIFDNTINLLYAGASLFPPSAIRLEHCINLAVGENVLQGLSFNNNRQQGINLIDVSGSHLFCNTFNHLSSGIVFSGSNSNDSVWHNTFLNADTCFQVGQSAVLYGSLNDQAGNFNYACGNEFQNASTLHLVKLTEPEINYYVGNNEQYPPSSLVNFSTIPLDLPVFSCGLPIGGGTIVTFLPDSCASNTPAHELLQSIMLQYPENGTQLINDNETLLWEMANTCPLECGEDVFTARALLQTKYEQLIFNDAALCGVANAISETDIPAFSFYPNPATEWIKISYGIAGTGKYDLKITDLSGRIMMGVRLPAGRNVSNLNISALQAGCYLLVLNEQVLQDKLIVVK